MDKKIAVLTRGGMKGKPGGSEKSIVTLANSLSKDNEVKVFSGESLEVISEDINTDLVTKKIYSKSNIFSTRINQFLRYIEFFRFKSEVESFNPDLILTQQEGILLGSYLSKSLNSKHIFFIRGINQTIEKIGFEGSMLLSKTLNYCFEPFTTKILGYSFHRTDEIIANSNYIAEKFEERWDISPKVVYPFVDENNFTKTEIGDKILHINPSKSKGIDITLDIASQLNEEFIIVGKEPSEDISQRIEDLENVEFLGYSKNMDETYSKAKIVLMPSVYEEPYGRVPIEAGLKGIPTISSGNGGLKESVGTPALCVDENTAKEYISKIEEIQNNYQKYSNLALENAKSKTKDPQIQKFMDIAYIRND